MTYEPIPYATPVGPPPLENSRRGWLIAFGVVSILIGSLAGCGTFSVILAFFMMGTMMGGAQAMPIFQLLAALAMYAGATVLFIWAGVDSIRCRRWVWPVVISVGWFVMIGTLFFIASVVMMLVTDSPLANSNVTTATTTTSSGAVVTTSISGAPPTTAMAIGMLVAGVVLGLIIPGAFVWFYSTAAVKLTLEAYQPERSWTERCPVPVFIACAGLLLGGFSTGLMAFEASTPFFGTYLESLPAIGLTLASAGAMLVAMVLMYRMNIIGWWMAFAVIALGFTSAIMTFCNLGMIEFYKRGHTSAAELDQMMHSPAMVGITPIVMSGVTGVGCLVYLIWVRKYFGPARREEAQ